MIDPQTAQLLGLQPTAPEPVSRWDIPTPGQSDAAPYQPAWDEYQHNRAESMRQLQRQLDDAAAADRGRQLIASGDGAGLPADLFARAQALVAAERESITRHEELQAAADAYITKNGLSVQAAAIHKELRCAESATARADATTAATAACVRLGRAAEQIQQAQQVLASVPQRRQEADRVWDVADAQIVADVAAAKRTLRDLGV